MKVIVSYSHFHYLGSHADVGIHKYDSGFLLFVSNDEGAAELPQVDPIAYLRGHGIPHLRNRVDMSMSTLSYGKSISQRSQAAINIIPKGCPR